MEYYHELVTQNSWEELQKLKRAIDFILIGGWATYLYTKTLKSKDIDIIIDYNKLPVLENHYQIIKNDRLKKYEAVRGEVQIDIYLPHYSEIGIPVEELMNSTVSVEGFTLLNSNYLLVLKIYTLQQRGRTPKGRKDFVDTIAIIDSNITDWKKVLSIVDQYKLHASLDSLGNFLGENYEIAELGMSKHRFSQLKKKILDNISS